MKSVRFRSRTLAAYAATFALAACAGFTPGGNSSAISANTAARTAKSQDLLYLTSVKTNTVAIYGYPNGGLVGKLTGLGKPRSECADSDGDVWVADVGAFQMDMYKPGRTRPAESLSTQGMPSGCSVNPVDGDLAIAGGPDGIVLSIFHRSIRKHWRDAKVFTDSKMATGEFCGYDAQGNLFLDGLGSDGSFRLAELPYLGKALIDISVSQTIKVPGQVQWDGKYVAIGDAGVVPSVVYQFSVKSKKATKAGSTSLTGSKSVRQFWIDGSTLIGPDYDADVGVWAYPAGGSPTKKYSVPGYGATISLAQ
jgi:hypothetical protein